MPVPTRYPRSPAERVTLTSVVRRLRSEGWTYKKIGSVCGVDAVTAWRHRDPEAETEAGRIWPEARREAQR